MNKYVVAFWSGHTGELLQEVVEANSPLEAGISYLNIEEEYLPTTMEELYSYCVNGDSMINILDLSKVGKGNTSDPTKSQYITRQDFAQSLKSLSQ